MYVKLAGETILVRCGSPGANVRGYTHHPVARAQGEQRRTIKEMYAPGFPPHRSVYIDGWVTSCGQSCNTKAGGYLVRTPPPYYQPILRKFSCNTLQHSEGFWVIVGHVFGLHLSFRPEADIIAAIERHLTGAFRPSPLVQGSSK